MPQKNLTKCGKARPKTIGNKVVSGLKLLRYGFQWF
jgi:hypothetical protein